MNDYQKKLKENIKNFNHLVYDLTYNFPKEESFNRISQIKRTSMSVLLNYVEGFYRFRIKVRLSSLETAYASLFEAKTVLEFAAERGWINNDEYNLSLQKADEIGAML